MAASTAAPLSAAIATPAAAPSVSYARVVKPVTDTTPSQPESAPLVEASSRKTAAAAAAGVAAVERGEEEVEEGGEDDDDESFMTVTSKKEKVKSKVDKVK
jgi:hypothetical protein